jgi:hypothetical protein
MYFLLAQILFALWAAWFAHFQAPIIKAMIAYVPVVNPYERGFHRRGFTASCIVACIIGLAVFAKTADLLQCLYLIPVFVASYGILFNGVIGLEIHRNFFYLGSTAKHDIWLNSKFPHGDAGEVKTIICIAIILVLNLINYFL